MVLRVDLPEGPFLADVGFGGLGLTAPLAVRLNVEQTTPHETMRLVPAGEALTLQAKLGENWENMYRLLPQPRLDTDYEIAGGHRHASHQPVREQPDRRAPRSRGDPQHVIQ